MPQQTEITKYEILFANPIFRILSALILFGGTLTGIYFIIAFIQEHDVEKQNTTGIHNKLKYALIAGAIVFGYVILVFLVYQFSPKSKAYMRGFSTGLNFKRRLERHENGMQFTPVFVPSEKELRNLLNEGSTQESIQGITASAIRVGGGNNGNNGQGRHMAYYRAERNFLQSANRAINFTKGRPPIIKSATMLGVEEGLNA